MYAVEITIAHTADTLNLDIYTNNDQNPDDETWGFSDLVIQLDTDSITDH